MQTTRPSYTGYIFDLDGTVYRGEQLIPGAQEKVLSLRAAGAKVVFLSNKPLEPRSSYAAKLSRLGIPTPNEDVINSAQAMFYHLRQERKFDGLYVIGEPTLLKEFLDEGFNLTEHPQDIKTVIAAFDRTLTYAKLNLAHQALVRGADFYATNADRTCPMAEGEIPDCAGVIAFLEATTGRKVQFVAGKPSPGILEAALARLGVARESCLMVGDRLSTDIRMGLSLGMDTALVLTGVTSAVDLALSEIKPTFIFESIQQVP
ncbi:MAG: HAD-IIA family hydrolase [Anaerolineae bacterium]